MLSETPIEFLPEPEPANAQSRTTWRLATAADMAALRLLRLDVELARGQAVYLPDSIRDDRAVFVAEWDGRVVGALVAEHAVVTRTPVDGSADGGPDETTGAVGNTHQSQ